MKTFIKWTKVVIVIAVLTTVSYYGYGFYRKIQSVNKIDIGTVDIIPTPIQTQEEKKASDIEKRTEEVRKREDHKKKVAQYDLNEAKRIAIAEYEKEQAEKYAVIKAEIEKSKEEVRKNELSLQ